MSEEKEKSSRGISLRTRRKDKAPVRPVIGAPSNFKQISGGGSGPLPTISDGAPRPMGASTTSVDSQRRPPPPQVQVKPNASRATSDLVKRRYSTRFTDLPTDFDATATPAPAMPTLPAQFAGRQFKERPKGPSQAGASKLAADMNAINDPNLRPEQYIAGQLSSASEEAILDYQQELDKMRSQTSKDLQATVYTNRALFIKISKEAEKLKGEMRALRTLMTDLKTNTTALRSASSVNSPQPPGFVEGSFSSGLSKRDKRSSVADRTALWNSQLQAMWKQIEGSQKYLPATPGRHVIQDAGAWTQLDNATWKSRRHVRIILLNDYILIAAVKKKRVEEGAESRHAESKVVAERCWSLLDVELVDLATENFVSSGGRTNVEDAISIRAIANESFTYRADKPGDGSKTSLLLNFRKAVDELRRNQRSEIDSQNKAKETINYFASRDPGLLKKTDLLETLSDYKDRPNILIEVDGKQQNLRWVEGQVDELDINIALQHFESAVAGVEKLKGLAKGLKSNLVAQDFISFKVEERADKLAGLITQELVDTHNNLKKTKCNTSWLSRLGFEDRAREAYLEARSDIILKRSRQCVFEGNLAQYIWQISFVYFTLIKNTVSVYQQCFPPLMMSACVKWAKEQVDAFNKILEKQLSGTSSDENVWQECMIVAKQHGAMLSEVGLEFKGLVGSFGRGNGADAAGGEPVGLGVQV